MSTSIIIDAFAPTGSGLKLNPNDVQTAPAFRRWRLGRPAKKQNKFLAKEAKMKKSNLLMGILGMTLVFGTMFSACTISASARVSMGGGGSRKALSEGVYVGIISFDAETHAITASPILLDATGKNTLKNAIDSQYKRSEESGTLLYYAVHEALHNMKALESRLPANAQSFNIITFTDGLDVGSTSSILWRDRPLDKQNFTGKTAEYLQWLNEQLETTTIKGYPITASSYGVAGSDVSERDVFQANLAKLATSKGQTNTSIDFNELSKTFGEIASGLNVSSTSFDLYITPSDNGTVYKMTFDSKVNSEADSKVYFTGTYNYDKGTHTLTDIKYSGVDASLTNVKGVEVGRKVKFGFGSFALSSGSLVQENIQQWVKAPDRNWQRNSEYDQGNTTTVEKSSAVIYLVLDSSKSLTDANVASIKAAAQSFIEALYLNYAGAENADFYNNRGWGYFNLGSYDFAIADYSKAIQLDPNYTWPYNNRGLVYFNQGKYDLAIADFNQAIRLDPNYSMAYNNRGAAYFNQGKYDLAIADCSKAIQLDPNNSMAYNNNSMAYNNRGVEYSTKGDYVRARADWEQALKLNPNNTNAKNNLEWLRQQRH
jgi:tetratricopeptide (TPR) repeat protein